MASIPQGVAADRPDPGAESLYRHPKPEKRLEAAMRLFIDPSRKLIKQITDTERHDLRPRSNRPAPSTWRDTDDSEDYVPEGSGSKRKRKRQGTPASDNETGRAKRRLRFAGLVPKGFVMVDKAVSEGLIDAEVEPIYTEVFTRGKGADRKQAPVDASQVVESRPDEEELRVNKRDDSEELVDANADTMEIDATEGNAEQAQAPANVSLSGVPQSGEEAQPDDGEPFIIRRVDTEELAGENPFTMEINASESAADQTQASVNESQNIDPQLNEDSEKIRKVDTETTADATADAMGINPAEGAVDQAQAPVNATRNDDPQPKKEFVDEKAVGEQLGDANTDTLKSGATEEAANQAQVPAETPQGNAAHPDGQKQCAKKGSESAELKSNEPATDKAIPEPDVETDVKKMEVNATSQVQGPANQSQVEVRLPGGEASLEEEQLQSDDQDSDEAYTKTIFSSELMAAYCPPQVNDNVMDGPGGFSSPEKLANEFAEQAGLDGLQSNRKAVHNADELGEDNGNSESQPKDSAIEGQRKANNLSVTLGSHQKDASVDADSSDNPPDARIKDPAVQQGADEIGLQPLVGGVGNAGDDGNSNGKPEDTNTVQMPAKEATGQSIDTLEVINVEPDGGESAKVAETSDTVNAPHNTKSNATITAFTSANGVEAEQSMEKIEAVRLITNIVSSASCSWCKDFAYGLVGFDSSEEGQMCETCEKERDAITKCPGHQTAPLEDLYPETFDFKAAYDSLNPDSVLGERIEKNKWCSVCPTPAFFRCSTSIQDENSAKTISGCGLLLCESCNIIIEVVKNISLVAAKNLKEEPIGNRADVCYLLRGTRI